MTTTPHLRFAFKGKAFINKLLLLAVCLLSVTGLKAQTSLYAEGADISSSISSPTFVISSAGTYTVSGNLGTPSDGQDYFQITVNSGLQLTSATYSVSGGGGFSGGWGFAGCCGNNISGNGSGSFSGASYPLSAGTYSVQMFANFSVGNSWVTTFTVTSTASAPSITSNPPSRTICAGSNTTFTVSANNATGYQWQVSTNNGVSYSNISNGGVYGGATTATLTLTSATSGMSGYRYRCVVTGATTPNAISSHGTLTVNSAPSITANPPNRTICAGSNTTFTVSANNTTGYQWQVSTNNGVSYNNVSNTGVYSGSTTSTLSITGATSGMSSYRYRCVVSGLCTPTASSNHGTLTINSAPSITSNPPSRTICAGSNTTFTVSANNATGYQWQVSTNNGVSYSNVSNGGVYGGATTATLTLTSATSGMSGYRYRCVASGSCTPDATSNHGTLTVNSAPSITSHPPDRTICEGSNTTFTVSANNTTGYQWQVSTNNGLSYSNISNTGVYSGATTATLTLTSATSGMSGYLYRCVLSGLCTPNLTSSHGMLMINSAPSITSNPPNRTICEGSNTTFSVTATGAGLSYQWEENRGTGWNSISNGGIYSGATTATLTLTAVTSANDGYQYRCVVSGTCSPTAIGTISNSASLTINSAPSITTQPTGANICVSGNTYFNVEAAGTSLSYQWQVDTGSGFSNISNGSTYANVTTDSLSVNAVLSMNGYKYRLRLTGLCGTMYSDTVTLSVYDPQVDSIRNDTTCVGTAAHLIAYPSLGSSIRWYDSMIGGSIIGISDTLTLSSVSVNAVFYAEAYINGNDSLATSYTGGNSHRGIMFDVMPSKNVTLNDLGLSLSANGSDYTVYYKTGTHVGFETNASAWIPLDTVYNVAIAGTNTKMGFNLNLNLNAGTKYAFYVTSMNISIPINYTNGTGVGNSWASNSALEIYQGTGLEFPFAGGAGLFKPRCPNATMYYDTLSLPCTSNRTAASLIVNTLPSVTGHPTNRTICAGNDTYYKVNATGTGATYQWQVNTGSGWSNLTNTGIYSGTTTDTLVLTAATTIQNGYQYRCVVSGTCSPSATSNAATLTINSAPSVTTQPINSTICDGGNTSFATVANGTGLTYQWQANTGSGWNNLTNTGIYSGATTATLNLTSATTTQNGYQYRCVIGGTCVPGVNTNAVTLTVNTLPSISAHPMNSTICLGNATYYKVVATGTGLTYQWQVNIGSGWNNLSNTGIYSGVTTDSLVLTAATASNNGYQYRAIVSGTCSPSATSNAASLTIDVAPSVTGQPTNRTICENTNTSFNVSATGTGIMYQWQVNTGSGWTNISNGGIYSGATTATLSLTGATTTQNGYQYRCVVSGTCTPGATSNTASLTIQTAPVVTVQPVNRTICSGDNTTFGVTATGTNLTYQWQVNTGAGWTNISNGGIYSNATTSMLNLTGATTTQHGYQYRVVVSGTCSPSATSNAASLTIDTAPAITSQPVNHTICSGGNTTFATTATGTSLTYQWQVNTGSSWTNISNGGIYSGATTATLSLTAATTSNNGYQYRCVVSGTCSPSATSVSATLTVNSLPSISVSPIAKTICDGNNTSYTVTASGTGISYQWQVNTGTGWTNISNGGIYGGATTSLLTLTGASTTYNGYQYRVVVSGTCTPSVTSSAANLTVHPIVTPTVGITASATTICATTSVTFTVSSSTNGGSSPSYQWKLNGNNVGSNSTTYSTTSLSNGDVVTCVMTTTAPCPTNPTATSNSITMTVNPLLLPTISISSATGDSVCDTRTATFTANITNGGSAPVYQWKINGSNVGTNSATYTTNTLAHGDVVSCELTSNALCATPNVVNSNKITMRVIPLSYASANINVTPSTTICAGEQVTVYCTHTNRGTNPKFEWYLNGNLQSNTAGSYTTTNLQDNDAIYCIYTNGNVCPEPVTTNTELMTVYQTVSPSVTVVASSGNVIAPGWTVTFTAQPTNGGANPTYAWRKNGNYIAGETGVTYTDNDLKFGDKIDVVMKGDWKCKDKEYSMSNVLVVNIPTDVGSQEGEVKVLELYPNPNKGTFKLKGMLGTGNGEAKVYIMNSVGQKVYETVVQVIEGRVEEQLRMPQSLSAGMYMLSIEIKGERAQKRFSIIE